MTIQYIFVFTLLNYFLSNNNKLESIYQIINKFKKMYAFNNVTQ